MFQLLVYFLLLGGSVSEAPISRSTSAAQPQSISLGQSACEITNSKISESGINLHVRLNVTCNSPYRIVALNPSGIPLTSYLYHSDHPGVETLEFILSPRFHGSDIVIVPLTV
jgi:hypothetical protein